MCICREEGQNYLFSRIIFFQYGGKLMIRNERKYFWKNIRIAHLMNNLILSRKDKKVLNFPCHEQNWKMNLFLKIKIEDFIPETLTFECYTYTYWMFHMSYTLWLASVHSYTCISSAGEIKDKDARPRRIKHTHHNIHFTLICEWKMA